MSNQMAQLQGATIKAHCKTLRMPMIASQFGTLAEQAIREKKNHMGYLEGARTIFFPLLVNARSVNSRGGSVATSGLGIW